MKKAFSLLALTVLAGFGAAEARAATAETPGDGGECGSGHPYNTNNCQTPTAVTGVRG